MHVPAWLDDDELFRAAYRLAKMAHASVETADQVVVAAIRAHELRSDSQERHRIERNRKLARAFNDAGRNIGVIERLPGAHPYKPELFQTSLLQFLIFAKSDAAATEPGMMCEVCSNAEEHLLARYLHFIVKKALKTSFQYAAVGIGQLVYEFTAPQVESIIFAITYRGGDHGSRADVKTALIAELEQRFPCLRPTQWTKSGEDKSFEPRAEQECYASTLREWLTLMTPWTKWPPPHVLGAGFSLESALPPPLDEKQSIMRRIDHPSEPDLLLLNRYHAVIEPQCFALLHGAVAKGISPRLRLPDMLRCTCGRGGPDMKDSSDSQMPSDRGSAPRGPHKEGSADSASNVESTSAAPERIRTKLMASGRRRGSFEDKFTVRIDGRFAATFTGTDVEVEVRENADLVEVYGRTDEGEVLLATHILEYDENGRLEDSTGSVPVGFWRRFSFHIDVAAKPLPRCVVRYSLPFWASWSRPFRYLSVATATAAVILLVFVFQQNTLLQRQAAELTKARRDAESSRVVAQKLEEEVARLAELASRVPTPAPKRNDRPSQRPELPRPAESQPLVASLVLAMPRVTLGAVEAEIQSRDVPANFKVLVLLVKLQGVELDTAVSAAISGGSKMLTRAELPITRAAGQAYATLELTAEEVGSFTDGRKELTVTLSQGDHASLGTIRLQLRQR